MGQFAVCSGYGKLAGAAGGGAARGIWEMGGAGDGSPPMACQRQTQIFQCVSGCPWL